MSQDRLEHMLRSQHNKHFLNLDECARELTENGELQTDNTLPVTLEAISKSEKHPPPADINGIDLKVLYRMLANMTAGYPVDELKDGPTKEFLRRCYAVSICRRCIPKKHMSIVLLKYFRDKENKIHTFVARLFTSSVLCASLEFSESFPTPNSPVSY